MTAPALLLCLFTALSAHLDDQDTQLVKDHLSQVESTLRDQDVSHLPARIKLKRAQSLDALRAYWQAGIFPKNTAYPKARVPVFIDAQGTACAMAHLIRASGDASLADRIAREQNFATIWEIRDPELPSWLASHGLSTEEAAWIQPSYAQEGATPCPCTCDFAPVHAHGVTYLNECVFLRCGGGAEIKELQPGCAQGADDVVTGWMVEGKAASLQGVCDTVLASKPAYETEQSEAFVRDVCAATTPTLTGDLWWTEKPAPKEEAQAKGTPATTPASGCKGCATAGKASWPDGQDLLWWGVIAAGVWWRRKRRRAPSSPPSSS